MRITACIIAAVFGLFFSPVVAQNLTVSPYSRFGVGDLFNNNSSRNIAMGGVGIGVANYFSVNRSNPASYVYAARTSLDFSGFYQVSQLSTSDTDQETQTSAGFQSINFVFPSNDKKVSLAMGFSPYSALGYSVSDENELVTPDSTYMTLNSYEAEGGLFQGYIGAAVKFGKKLSVGANLTYTFGNNLYGWQSYVVNPLGVQPLEPDPNFQIVSISERIFVNNLGGQFGVQFSDTLNKESKMVLRLGATADLNFDLKGDRLGFVGNGVVIDTFRFLEGRIVIPPAYGVGFELSVPLNWSLAGDFAIQNWNNFEYFGNSAFQGTTNSGDSVSLGRSIRMALGAEWIPKINDTKYGRRIAYRIGAYRSQTYLNYNNKPVNDTGFTLGFGFPTSIRKSTIFSSARINASFQFGQRGNSDFHPLNERYARFQLGITINELWFFKREVD